VTVSNARQSARAEMPVTVFGLTGRWVSSGGTVTMQLTQTGSAVTGRATWENGPGETPYSDCVITGSVEAGVPPGTPAVILLTQPACAHPVFAKLAPLSYRLNMAVGGQTIAGTFDSPSGSTRQIALNR